MTAPDRGHVLGALQPGVPYGRPGGAPDGPAEDFPPLPAWCGAYYGGWRCSTHGVPLAQAHLEDRPARGHWAVWICALHGPEGRMAWPRIDRPERPLPDPPPPPVRLPIAAELLTMELRRARSDEAIWAAIPAGETPAGRAARLRLLDRATNRVVEISAELDLLARLPRDTGEEADFA